MPEWEEHDSESLVTAKQAMARLKGAKETGDSGMMALEGDEAMKLLAGLFGDKMPEGLKEALENGQPVITAKLVSPFGEDKESLANAKETLDKLIDVKTEDDENWWSAQRPVGVPGEPSVDSWSMREIKEKAEETLELADKGEASPEEGGLAIAVLYLLGKLVEASDLLRSSAAIINEQREAMDKTRPFLERYRDHMIVEHGVSPDGL
jgi:hypothetical protein